MWTHARGFLQAGGDLTGTPLNTTLDAAERFCAANESCCGFTFQSDDAAPAAPVKTYFKMECGVAGSSHWQAYTRKMPWERPLRLHKMQDMVQQVGARCLDGSPGSFYFGAATAPKLATTWQIFLQGGGWCYSVEDCAVRARGGLGSSNSLPPEANQIGYASGIFSNNPWLNPDFAGSNSVYVNYCDGNSFSSNATEPVSAPSGQQLHFRGHRILEAVLLSLARDHGLADATDVLLTGCSAGGLATLLQADYVGSRVRALSGQLARFKAAPCSGFFLDHANAEGSSVYPGQMRTLFALSGAANGVDRSCLAANAGGSEWKCNMAEHAYPHVSVPLMVLNSALDCWQVGCILAAEPVAQGKGGSNGNCSASQAFPKGCACYGCPIEKTCDAAAFHRFDSYEADFTRVITSASTSTKRGNGAFIHSCYSHCAGSRPMFNTIAIGNVTMQAAVSAWWRADAGTAPPMNHIEPCSWRGPADPPCNPTCPSADERALPGQQMPPWEEQAAM